MGFCEIELGFCELKNKLSRSKELYDPSRHELCFEIALRYRCMHARKLGVQNVCSVLRHLHVRTRD